MATVTLDPSGRRLGFSRIVTSPGQPGVEPAWPEVFREANLDFNAFSRAQADQRPLVPHDEVTAWVRGQSDAAPVRVTGATLAQIPVAFEVQPMGGEVRDRGVITTGRSRLSEGVLWVIVMVTFSGTAVMVRRHLRAGEGDLHGARTLAAVAVIGGMLSMLLQAHHVPDVFHELWRC